MAAEAKKVTPLDIFIANIDSVATSLIAIIADLKDDGYTKLDSGMVTLAKTFVATLKKEEVMKQYVENSHMHWDKIHGGNREFFVGPGAASIFSDLPADDVKAFREMFTARKPDGTYALGTEDITLLFTTFGEMTRAAIRHIHEQRMPTMAAAPDGTMKRAYRNGKYMACIEAPIEGKVTKLSDLAKLWGVTLTFPSA